MEQKVDINRLGKAIQDIMNARLEKEGLRVTVTLERKKKAS